MAFREDERSFKTPQRSPYQAIAFAGEVDAGQGEFATGTHSMSQPLVVTIPHRLGRQEAVRRIKSGIAAARANYSALLSIQEETWIDNQLAFHVSAIGQSANGLIDVAEDHVRLEVTLPWLLAKVAEKFTPAIRKEGVLMLEKK
jgi:hypothetical protein